VDVILLAASSNKYQSISLPRCAARGVKTKASLGRNIKKDLLTLVGALFLV